MPRKLLTVVLLLRRDPLARSALGICHRMRVYLIDYIT